MTLIFRKWRNDRPDNSLPILERDCTSESEKESAVKEMLAMGYELESIID